MDTQNTYNKHKTNTYMGTHTHTCTHIYEMCIIVGVLQNTYDRKLEKERKMGK